MWFADLNRRFNYVMDGDLNWARASLRARFNFRLQIYVYANSNYDLMNSLDLDVGPRSAVAAFSHLVGARGESS